MLAEESQQRAVLWGLRGWGRDPDPDVTQSSPDAPESSTVSSQVALLGLEHKVCTQVNNDHDSLRGALGAQSREETQSK